MIKKLLITYLFLITNVFAGLPPTTVKGQAEAVKTTTFNVEVPYSQATTTAAGTRLLEVGNNNILANGSFEHSTYDTGWTCSLGTKTKETTTVFKGKNSMKIVSAGAGTRCYIYSTTDAAKLKGQQGHATVRVNSTDSVLQVCALAGGTTSAFDTNCVTVPVTTTETPWRTVVIPTIMDGTGNGVVIKSAETLTKTVFVDEVEYKHGLPVQSVNGARLMGTVTITGCASGWSTSSATFASFGAQTGCTYTTTGSAIAPSTNIPAIKFASLSAGDYRLEYEGILATSANGTSAFFQFSDGINTARESSTVYAGSSTSQSPGLQQSISYSNTQSNITLEIKGKSTSGSAVIYGTTAYPGVIKVWYFPPVSTIYTDFNKGYSENAGEVFPYAGTVCPAGTLPADGSPVSRTTYSELFAKIGIAHGQGDGSTTFNLPDYRGRFLRGVDGTAGNDPDKASRTAMNTGGNTGNNVGSVQGDAFQGHWHEVQSFSGVTPIYPYGGSQQGGGSGTGVTNNRFVAKTMLADGTNGTPRTSSETRAKNAYVNYCIRAYNKNITGSFENIEKCATANECNDTFSAKVSATGVVTNENTDWIDGNAAQASGVFTITFKTGTFTVAPNCVATVSTNSDPLVTVESPSSTGVTVRTKYYNTSPASISFNLICQKQGVDYFPKTAKVAVSTGVNRTDGVERPEIFSFNYSNTSALNDNCSSSSCYVDQIGSAVSTMTRSSSANYNIVFGKTYSKVKCVANYESSGTGYGTPKGTYKCSNCSSLPFVAPIQQGGTMGVSADSQGTVICQGIPQ